MEPKEKQSMVEPNNHSQDKMAIDQAKDRVKNAQTKPEKELWQKRLEHRTEALERRMEKLEKLDLK